MTDRRRGKEDRRENRREEATAPRMSTFFVPGAGIDREVITTDICRYLGNDALVRPGDYKNSRGDVIQGYFVTAYRALTTNQLADLKADSVRWQNERQRNQSSRANTGGISQRDLPDIIVRNSNSRAETYRGSITHREQWGPEPGAEYQSQNNPARQPEHSYNNTAGYTNTGMQQQPPSVGYGVRPQEYPAESQNYTSYNRAPTMDGSSIRADNYGLQVGNYEVSQTAATHRSENPRFPSATGYLPPDSQMGRGTAPNLAYPSASSYVPYADQGGMPPPSTGGRPLQQQGVSYDSYTTQPQQQQQQQQLPRDPGYGRSQPAAQPGAEEGFSANDDDFEDESMDDTQVPQRYEPQPAREAPRTQNQRETPPTSKRSHHSEREHRRR